MDTRTAQNWMHWAGLIITGLVTLFMLVDAVMKLMQFSVVLETTTQLGWPVVVVVPLGATLLMSTALYVFPRTSLLGAILLTAYLGGAVATHVRVGAPVFNVIFAVALGMLIWGGLWLRDQRLRDLMPWQASR